MEPTPPSEISDAVTNEQRIQAILALLDSWPGEAAEEQRETLDYLMRTLPHRFRRA